MDKYTETSATWNQLAKPYQEKFMGLNLYDATYDHVCAAIQKQHPQILEMGCGPGNITKYLLSKRPDFDIFGIDIAPNMIELARLNNPGATFSVMDCRDIHLLGTKYDGIIGGFCLPYLLHADGEKLLADCSNLLHENGLLYLSFVEGDPEKSYYQTGPGGQRIYFNFYRQADIIGQLGHLNFRDVHVFYIDYPRNENEVEKHTILTAVKSKT
jgi:2-polyprenyl-3-methyl-5-hydroxy-6-metoxy-1,4-benzoquinol methylase